MAPVHSFAPIFLLATVLAAPKTAAFTHSGKAGEQPQTAVQLAVGDTVAQEDIHIISEPGLYGLGRNIGDSEYAVAGGYLVRIDPKSLKILSILRAQAQILD